MTTLHTPPCYADPRSWVGRGLAREWWGRGGLVGPGAKAGSRGGGPSLVSRAAQVLACGSAAASEDWRAAPAFRAWRPKTVTRHAPSPARACSGGQIFQQVGQRACAGAPALRQRQKKNVPERARRPANGH